MPPDPTRLCHLCRYNFSSMHVCIFKISYYSCTCTLLSWDMVRPKDAMTFIWGDSSEEQEKLSWSWTSSRSISKKQKWAPDPGKVNTFEEMPRCTCKKELRNLVGLLKYLSQFLPCLSMIAFKEAACPSGQHIRLNSVVPGLSPTLATCWICSRSSRVQILGHTSKRSQLAASYQLGFSTLLCPFEFVCFITPKKTQKGRR